MRTPVWALVGMLCFVGAIAGWATRAARKPRVRLLIKPKKTQLTVLIPPGPVPRLVAGESPKATRVRAASTQVVRTVPAGTGSGIIDYIAPFASSGEAGEETRVDFLLEEGDGEAAP